MPTRHLPRVRNRTRISSFQTFRLHFGEGYGPILLEEYCGLETAMRGNRLLTDTIFLQLGLKKHSVGKNSNSQGAEGPLVLLVGASRVSYTGQGLLVQSCPTY